QRIARECLWRSQVFGPVVAPEACFTAKCGDSAVGRNAGARQNDDALRLLLADGVNCPLQRVHQPSIPRLEIAPTSCSPCLILSGAKDLKIRFRRLRSFAVFAAQDDVTP